MDPWGCTQDTAWGTMALGCVLACLGSLNTREGGRGVGKRRGREREGEGERGVGRGGGGRERVGRGGRKGEREGERYECIVHGARSHQFPKCMTPVVCHVLIFGILAGNMMLPPCGHHQGTMIWRLQSSSGLEDLCQNQCECSVWHEQQRSYLRMPIVFAVGVSVITLAAVVSSKYSS